MIKHNKLNPLFRPSSLKAKQERDALKEWKAFYYTLQQYAWREACQNMIAEGKQTGFLVWDEKEESLITTDDLYDEKGTLLLAKGSRASDWFNVEKPGFVKQFEEAYIEATKEELANEILRCYGLDAESVKRENAARLAEFRKRDQRV